MIKERLQEFLAGGKVKKSVMVQFYHQLSTLCNAGFGMLRALRVCEANTSCPVFKKALQKMEISIEGGAPLARTWENFPDLFTPFHIGMIKTAERSGTLPAVLINLAAYEEKEMRLISNLKAALAYPIFVTISAVVIVIMLTRCLCPLLDSVAATLGPDKIPVVTRILIFVGKCMSDIRYIIAVLLFILIAIYIFKMLSEKKKVKYLLGRLKLRIPSFGKMYRKVIMIRMCRVLSTLLNAGVPSVLSVRVVDEVADNVYFSEAVMKKIIWRVEEGRLFSEAFGESSFFPKVLINMFVVGEQTGRLPFIIDKIADLFEIDVNLFLANIGSILEPLLIVVLGGITFFILLSAFLPLYTIMNGL